MRSMSEIMPTSKTITYPTLKAEINYTEREMTLTNLASGESITIASAAYPELQAIMSDIGRQASLPGKSR
jgi:hypothetical protein